MEGEFLHKSFIEADHIEVVAPWFMQVHQYLEHGKRLVFRRIDNRTHGCSTDHRKASPLYPMD